VSSLSQLIGCFHAAQKRASFRCDAGAWSDDKALRKEHWVGLGVPIALIVPTLHTCSFVDDPMGGVDVGAEADFAVDDDGQYVPVLTTSRTLLAPSDPCCELRLEVLLRHHKRLVLKPTMGTNSGGLLCLSLDQIEPLRFVPMPSGEPRPRLANPPNLSNGSLWAYAPVKALSAGDASVREVRRARWFAELILMTTNDH